MKNKWIYILLLFTACSGRIQEPLESLIAESEHSVLMFFAPDCPLCVTFSKPVNDLIESYPHMQFFAVLSGEHYSTKEVDSFFQETGLNATLLMDEDYQIAHSFNVGVTPEFVVINKELEVLYQGLLDDRMKNIGVYKKQWSNNFLSDALICIKEGGEVYPKKTKAIGCVLEY